MTTVVIILVKFQTLKVYIIVANASTYFSNTCCIIILTVYNVNHNCTFSNYIFTKKTLGKKRISALYEFQL